MIAAILECAAGAVLAVVVLHDVFDTAVVPGRGRGGLMVSRRISKLALPLWRHSRRTGVGVDFAPAVLVASFIVWLVLLILAFGLMLHAFQDGFTPPLQGFGDALYVSGGAMTTMGFAPVQPHGAAAALTVIASFSGLAVVTMAVTYLLEVQSNIGRRDTGVLKISTSAGEPPSAVALLERYAALDEQEELSELLRGARDWCATVLQSHASHPSLIYFRSAGTGSGWPATLGTLVDLSLLIEMVLDRPKLVGSALLLRAQALRLSTAVTELLGLDPQPLPDAREHLGGVCERLRAAGYPLRGDIDARRFSECRQRDAGRIEALAKHLGTEGAPLLPGKTPQRPS